MFCRYSVCLGKIIRKVLRYNDMMTTNKYYHYILSAMACWLLAACVSDDSFSTSQSNVLTFSADTLSLDTTFSNVPTPMYSMWVYNHSGDGIRCSSVSLQSGNQTGFRVNVDGTYLGETTGYQTHDVEIRKGDSLRVFVELTSPQQGTENPRLVEDNLVFTLESGRQQKVNLKAYSWDALLYNNVRIQTDSTLQSAKPIVVYGGLRVDSAATLTIAAGTALYFHEDAGMDVYGTLHAKGEAGKEVVLRGDRLDHMFSYLPYDRTPGRWQGVRFHSSSYGNTLHFTDIHSAYNGVLVDSCDLSRLSLTMSHSTIHNCQGFGLYVDSAKVAVENCQLSNALYNCLHVRGGGDVDVNATTIAQFYPFDAQRVSAVGFAPPLTNLSVRNSLVTGYADDEVMWMETDSSELLRFSFDHCVLRTVKMDTADSLKFTNIVYEDVKDTTMYGEKHFRLFDTDNLDYDFRLKSTSPAIGVADAATSPVDDRNGQSRDDKPDAGCFEYREQ